jgi:hypothetical protein
MATKGKRKKEIAAALVESPEQVDEKKVERAVSEIRDLLQETLYKAVVAVGEYVLRTFFHDDPALVSSKDPNKSASFRALAERCGADLPISKSWLHNAVAVVIMQRALPEGANYKQLPPSHQTALLPLRSPQAIEKLAKRAVEKNLSVRDLRTAVGEEVAKTRSDESPRGRPKKAILVKTLDRATKLFTFEGGRRSFTKAMLDELEDEDVVHAVKATKDLIERLQGLVEKLEARG